jgi:hypothetical protein
MDRTQPSWLELRWSADRVCLSAADLPAVQIESPAAELDTRLVARLDANADAVLLAIGEGVELVDRRRCELVSR